MLWLPPLAYREVQNTLAATPSSNMGAAITGGGTAHTKGSWAQLLASTNFETEWMVVAITSTFVAATQTDTLVDIGIGAAASEQVLVPNLLAGWAPNASIAPRLFSAPIYIPKGSRISARAQSITVSKSVTVTLFLFGGARQPALPTFSRVDAIGVSTAASQGTSVTSGNTGTEGSWTSIGSTTAKPYKALYLLVQGTLTDTTQTGLAYHFEVGYSSTTLAEFYFHTDPSERINGPFPAMPVFHPIPTGTQLQVRGEASGTAEPIDVALYGMS